MIKVTYYVGTNDKDTLKQELSDRDFYKVFDKLFSNYTLQKAQGVYTMQETKTVVKEDTFIVTTLVEESDIKAIDDLKVYNNAETLKNKLNQESILVEITEPNVMFL